MKNMGTLDLNWNPVKAGGLADSEISYLKSRGWKAGTTKEDILDVPIGFAAPDLPGGFTMHNFSVPKGTRFLYNPEDERAVILGCGNPTCWRYLVPRP